MSKTTNLWYLTPWTLALLSVAMPTLAKETVTARIQFGQSITVQGKGAVAKAGVVTISKAGVYQLSGTTRNARVVVDSADKNAITLVLNNLDLSSEVAPIEIIHAEEVVLSLPAGSKNQVADTAGARCAATDNELNAAIYSREDVTITGAGSLTVQGRCHHGVLSKDSLKIQGGTLLVTALKDGLRGKDAVHIKAGNITVNAGSDGVIASNDSDANKGRVVIDGGVLHVTAAHDAVQAASNVLIHGGTLKLTAGGGAAQATPKTEWGRGSRFAQNATQDAPSVQGLKAGADIVISAGKLNIDAAGDALNAKQQIHIEGGELHIAAGDDALHADQALSIQGGNVDIERSYEGVESRTSITLTGGIVRVRSSDDGINVASGGGFGWGPMRGPSSDGTPSFVMSGGYVSVESGGDGIDINASAAMTGGTLVVNGPTSNMNGPLDYDGSFQVSGGTLIASGSAGMAQAPGNFSTQYSVSVYLSSMVESGTPLRIVDERGNAVLNVAPLKPYQSLVLSSPELKQGQTYIVYAGGEFTGQATDGVYTKAADYEMGEELGRFTVTDTVSYVGGGSRGLGGWGGRGGGRGMGGR